MAAPRAEAADAASGITDTIAALSAQLLVVAGVSGEPIATVGCGVKGVSVSVRDRRAAVLHGGFGRGLGAWGLGLGAWGLS